MRLCSRGWETLSVDSTPIAVDDLIPSSEGGYFPQEDPWSVAPENHEIDAESNYINPRSTAIDQLMGLLDLNGLEHLLNASRAAILALGNQRYCTKNRAEAIMLAIDVMDWYVPLETDSRPSEMDQYPLAFLHEAARQVGAEFYGSAFGERELLEMLLPSLKQSSGGAEWEGKGTMLPFTSSRHSRGPGFAEGYTATRDRPSVATWAIQPDFSVHILKAGVLSCTGQVRRDDRPVIRCTITGPCSPVGDEETPSLLVCKSIRAWISTYGLTLSSRRRAISQSVCIVGLGVGF